MIWTPPSVTRRTAEFTSEYSASVDRMVDRMRGVIDDFNRDLKRMDPSLELVFAPPNANEVGLEPGYYHVMRRTNDGTPPTLIAIKGPNGEFVEPDSGLFSYLQSIDLWNDRAKADREKAQDEARKAAERRAEQERLDRVCEAEERWAAASRAFVSMDRSVPWTQTTRGRRGARR